MDSALVIRNAQASDAAALSEFAIETYSAAFGHSFSEADLAAHLERNLSPSHFGQRIEEDVVLLAEVGGRLIGYAQFGAMSPSSEHDGDQELRRLYVHPAFQNRGYGGALMEAILRHPRITGAAHIYLDVWEHNHAAQRFYRRYGFEVVGTRAFEVASGAPTSLDLVMMRRYEAAVCNHNREGLEVEDPASSAWAAFRPGMPLTHPPGNAPDPHR